MNVASQVSDHLVVGYAQYTLSVGADNTHARTEDNQEWHDGNQTENFRQNEVTC